MTDNIDMTREYDAIKRRHDIALSLIAHGFDPNDIPHFGRSVSDWVEGPKSAQKNTKAGRPKKTVVAKAKKSAKAKKRKYTKRNSDYWK